MIELLFLGGPLHGQHRRLSAATENLTAMKSHRGCTRHVIYRRRRVLVRGWRFPLDCLTTWTPDLPIPDGCLLPGYVHGVPAEQEPNPRAAPPKCRCATARQSSACHLDRCRLHGPFRVFREKGTTAHG